MLWVYIVLLGVLGVSAKLPEPFATDDISIIIPSTYNYNLPLQPFEHQQYVSALARMLSGKNVLTVANT
jgi:hypothetical protein